MKKLEYINTISMRSGMNVLDPYPRFMTMVDISKEKELEIEDNHF